MGALLASVLPLALGAAISPTLLALQLLVLAGPAHRLARAWSLAAGSALVLAVYAFCGITVLGQIHGKKAPHHSLRDALVELVCAALLVALALRARVRHRTAGEHHGSWAATRLAGAPLPWFIGAGALGMLTNFSTLVLFLPALHQIERAQVSTVARWVVFAVLYAITLLPVLLPVAAAALLGRRAEPVLDRVHIFIGTYSRQIGVVIELDLCRLPGVEGRERAALSPGPLRPPGSSSRGTRRSRGRSGTAGSGSDPGGGPRPSRTAP